MAWNPKIEETRLGVGARVQQERKGRAKRRWEIKPTTRLFARVRSVHVIYRHNTRLFRRLEATRHIHLTLELASLRAAIGRMRAKKHGTRSTSDSPISACQPLGYSSTRVVLKWIAWDSKQGICGAAMATEKRVSGIPETGSFRKLSQANK